MARLLDSVDSDSDLPAKTDVAIIGGGIIGVATAYFLAERGIAVALFEKGEIAGEQSSRNWGWCRQMRRDPREIPLIIESLSLWRSLNERIGDETGFRQGGIVYLAESEAELSKHDGWLAHARQYQLDSRIIGAEEVAKLMPGATRAFAGALYTPSDGRAEPHRAAPALARAARRRGAKVLTGCAVRGIETGGGRISGIVTERGVVACASAVLAGGAWSRLFAGNCGITLPQLKVINSVMRTAPLETGFEGAAAGGDFALRKRLDGGFTIAHNNLSIADIVPDSFRLLRDFLPAYWMDPAGLRFRFGRAFVEEARRPRHFPLDRETPFERTRILDPEPGPSALETALRSLVATYPAFKGVEIVDRWAGAIDVTPDAVPVISAVGSVPGFHIATGFSGHGFGIGPGAGRLMADIVTGTTPLVDPAPFRYARFSDGSRPRPIAGF